MSVRLVSDYEIGIVAGFSATQPSVLPKGWGAEDLARQIRTLNMRAFENRYPRSQKPDLLDCPKLINSNHMPDIIRSAQDIAFNLPDHEETKSALLSIIHQASR